MPTRSEYVKRTVATSFLVTILVACAPASTQTSQSSSAFTKENDEAMSVMMEAMHVKPSGDVDRDFVAMMIPHHQGAIDMAQAQLRHGRSERLKRLSRQIVAKQQQEIEEMRLAMGELASAAPTPGSGAADTEGENDPGAMQHKH